MAQPTDFTRSSAPGHWLAFGLTAGGGILFGASQEAVLKVLGVLLIAGGAALLGWKTRATRDLIRRILSAIPLADKGESLLRELPRAWAQLEKENLILRERARQEDQLRMKILASLREGVLLLDRDRRLNLFNPAASSLLGSSSRLAAGVDWAEIFREPESLRKLDEAYAGEGLEWTLRREPRVLRVRALPFALNQAEGGLLVTLDDITRQEALEITRQKFISNASHELKTPSTSIRIATEDLLEGGYVMPGGEPSLRLILRAIDRMTLLLNDITELSRIETGALELNPQRFEVGPLARRLIEDSEPQALTRKIKLELQVEEPLPPVVADPHRLGQLLENLISNAVKFSPEGAKVLLRIASEPGWITWSVKDEGPGIAKAEQARIFERFYRSPATRAVPGTGLGLAIVKHLGRLLGGEIQLSSELGQGATFSFRMPCADK